MSLFSQIFMNYNLVTKLKMQCFNSLFHCKAADLFNQHSKYVCSSFHARSRSSSWELIFLLFKHLMLFGYEKKPPFFVTAIKPNRNKRNISACQVLLTSQGAAVERSWARWQRAHSTLLPPELGWAESTPKPEPFP